MSWRSRRRSTGGLIGLALLMASCSSTYVWKVPVHAVQLPTADRIDLNVALVLTESYRNATYVLERENTVKIPIGDNLSENAKRMASTAFAHVDVLGAAPPPPIAPADAVLTPRVMAIEESATGMFAWDDISMSVKVSWTLTGRQGEVIWAETITGEGTNSSGNVFTMDSRRAERVALMMDDLFGKSLRAITGSGEIRAYAAASAGRAKP